MATDPRPTLTGLLLLLCFGCGADQARRFPLRAPLGVDPDQHSFRGAPEEYFSPFAWDAADQTIFRPISQFFKVSPAQRAINVNAIDEVPDSSWFTNRIGKKAMSPLEAGLGACTTPPLAPVGPWVITGGKPDGANPGFMMKTQDDRRYVIKFDGLVEGPRATAADVIGSRVYHAAGYFAPCNRVVYFDRSILEIEPGAMVEDAYGHEVPFAGEHLETILSKAIRMSDGRYRASSSLFLPGKLIGPWRYQGTRADDPNDVVPHEDRREIRGARVFAAWLNHFDSREMNTLASFVERQPGVGYVRHYFIDFGDSLGSIWEPPMLGRRLGHANYLDFGDLVEDFVSLGAIRRPWDRARFGPTGTVFGYYDVELFDPDKWQPGYPNPAFSRMQEADAAWAARILARFGDAQLDAMIDEAQLYDGRHVDRLRQVLRGRRAKLLERYLNALSPLSEPRLNTNAERHRLCLQDLRVNTSYVGPPPGAYAARHWHSPDFRDSSALTVSAQEAEVCADFPEGLRHHAEPQYHIVDVWDAGRKPALPPTRVHFYVTTNGAHVVGLERPCNHASPAE